MEPPRPSILGGYRSGLRGVVGASATAYGYTLTVGPSSMLLTGTYGPPKPFEVLLFCSGAIVAFALVGALAFGGVRGHFGDPPKKNPTLGQFPLPLGGAGRGSRLPCGHLRTRRPGLAAGAFAATATYLIVVGFESAAADLERRRG